MYCCISKLLLLSRVPFAVPVLLNVERCLVEESSSVSNIEIPVCMSSPVFRLLKDRSTEQMTITFMLQG